MWACKSLVFLKEANDVSSINFLKLYALSFLKNVCNTRRPPKNLQAAALQFLASLSIIFTDQLICLVI